MKSFWVLFFLASGFYPWPGPDGPGLGPAGPEFFFKDAPPFLFERLLKVFEKLLGSIFLASGDCLKSFWVLFFLASGFYPWPGPDGPGLGPAGPEFFFKDAPPFLFERLLKVFEKLLGSILLSFWGLLLVSGDYLKSFRVLLF